MSRLNFDSQGRLSSVDQRTISFEPIESKPTKKLKDSSSLQFLQESQKIENAQDTKFWSLYENDKPLPPLKFSNNKTQEDITKEIVDHINDRKKLIFLHGVCGTGKSAIALNIARAIGKASIVVPVKALQKQYEQDYMGQKYVLKENGEKLKIAMITGRDNHDSIIFPGKSCADPYLPDTIKLTERNKDKLKEYFQDNPFVNSKAIPEYKALRRISIAPSNPYWSPIVPAAIELNQLKDADKKRYTGNSGQDYIFYHRKRGCSYYDQYLAYFNADVIIFNSAKYLAEISLGRKPQTEVEIIDEADEFLDSFSNSIEINLTRLSASLKKVFPENDGAQYSIDKILKLLNLEEQNKRAIGIDESLVLELNETKIADILTILGNDKELESEIEMDELNYANVGLEASKNFKDSISSTFVTYRKDDDQIYAKLVTTNLAKKFKEIVDSNKALVLMSGTIHSQEVLKHLFGIDEYTLVEAETLNQGSLEIVRTGKEFDCKYSNLRGESARENYLYALSTAIEKSTKPTLVHVNAYADLPKEEEAYSIHTNGLTTKESLLAKQQKDKTGSLVSDFKEGKFPTLFTTKCKRGIDFPGEMCNSVIFTKYPNPNVQDTFWKILQRTHPDYYWEFYRDKARREFLQRIYRAVRSKDDHVYILSPDMRVLNAVRELQEQG